MAVGMTRARRWNTDLAILRVSGLGNILGFPCRMPTSEEQDIGRA